MRDDDTATVPAIPGPRPAADEVADQGSAAPPYRCVPEPEVGADGYPVVPPPEAGGRRRTVRIALAVAGVVALLAGTIFVVDGKPTKAAGQPIATPTAEQTVPETPYDKAVTVLRQHASALLDGDEAGWMAAVDPGKPALVKRYRGLFRSLRALGVTNYFYLPGSSAAEKKDRTAITFPTEVFYCFGADTCGVGDSPSIGLALTMRDAGGRMVISAVARHSRKDHDAEPVPWQDGTLQVVRGKRVVVAAEPGEAKQLPRVLPIAESAAVAADRFAAMMQVGQTRYRVYLAGEKQWRKWYGGETDNWATGLAVRISQSGHDVTIRIRRVESQRELRELLQHEFGHVVTLTGAMSPDASSQWLEEGVAEYIGMSPRHATDSWRIEDLRRQAGRRVPTSMVPAPQHPNDTDRDVDAFYGLSHLAVDCMAQKYGEPSTMRFVRLVLVSAKNWNEAAKEAFHQPFPDVNKACTAWIRRKV